MERKGWLRLYAFQPLEAGKFLKVGNTLTQRSFRSAQNEVVVKIDISHTADGLHAGLCHFAEHRSSLGIVNDSGTNYLEWTDNDQRIRHQAISPTILYLRSTWGLDGKSQFSYSLDGDHYIPLGQYQLSWGFYRGDRIGSKDGRWYIYPTVNGYMHVGVADSPDGPFRLVQGKDEFTKPAIEREQSDARIDFAEREQAQPEVKPYADASTLLKDGDRGGIDAEVFIDADGQAYVFWGRRYVARLADDMMTVSDIRQIETRRKEYSEGPIFFKRKGIYYYLYTIGGGENYEYYYQMSRMSPFGPWETPEYDLVSTTNVERGVFGPGHGCVFNVGDDYYFAFLEFGRNSTNRQTYVNRLEFNDDGTIRQVEVSLDGVGALRKTDERRELKPVAVTASSTMAPQKSLLY